MKDPFSLLLNFPEVKVSGRGQGRSIACCFPRDVGRHCLFQQPQGIPLDCNRIPWQYLLNCKMLLIEKILKKYQNTWGVESAAVCVHEYLSCDGEGRVMNGFSFSIRVSPHFSGISSFILRRYAVRLCQIQRVCV